MKLILHIGTEKTGTTSLQKWMCANRDAINSQGVFYSHVLGTSRHINASVYSGDFANGDKIAYRLRDIRDEPDLKIFRDRLQQEFRTELAKARLQGCGTCFISDEGLQAVLRTVPELERLKNELLQDFDEIEVVICLRPQVDYGISLASTFSRLGFTINQAWFSNIKPSAHRFNYAALVEMWSRVFGAESIRLIPYKQHPRSIPLFKEILGLSDRGAVWTQVKRENAFVDWRYMQLINQAQGEERHYLRSVLDKLPHFEKLTLGTELAAEIAARFDESNGKLVQARGDIMLADLHSDEESNDALGSLKAMSTQVGSKGLVFDLIRHLAADQVSTT